jgi:Mce-associated membrane protein
MADNNAEIAADTDAADHARTAAVGDTADGIAQMAVQVDDDDAMTGTAAAGIATATNSSVRRVSISLRSLLVGLLIVALVAAVGVMSWLYIGAENKLDTQAQHSEDVAHAEKVALDYATNAAAMNFQDLDSWKVKLVAGTSSDLKDRLNKAAEQMQQILVPLQWNSTSAPLASKVRSNNGGVYVVDSFVSVKTKTVQEPDALQSTATYSVTVDSNKNWQITDVGGVGAVVGGK